LSAIKEDGDAPFKMILEDIEDFESTGLHHNYDMINLREREETDPSPFRNQCIDQLKKYYAKTGDKESNPQLVIDSKHVFAVDIQIYLKEDKGSEAILVLAEEVVILLFKFNKAPVVQPFSIKAITNMMLAENVPSACTLEVDEETEKKINRSHLVMESPSMGLLMRYILEREYSIELDFTDSVPIRIGQSEIDFCFADLVVQREIDQMEENSGIIRSTFDGVTYELESGGVFGSDKWHRHFCVLTNIGLFKFNERDLLQAPVLISIKTLNLLSMKG